MHMAGWLSSVAVIASLQGVTALASPSASKVLPVPPPDSTARTFTDGEATRQGWSGGNADEVTV